MSELCCICYSNDNRVITSCNHILCSSCLFSLHTLKCPLCRTSLFSNVETNIDSTLQSIFDIGTTYDTTYGISNNGEFLQQRVYSHSPPLRRSAYKTLKDNIKDNEFDIRMQKHKIFHRKRRIISYQKRIKRVEKEIKESKMKMKKNEKKLKQFIKSKGKRGSNVKKGYLMYYGIYYNNKIERVLKDEAICFPR